MILPSDFSLLLHQTQSITLEQVMRVVKALMDGTLTVRYVSSIQGKDRKWIEMRGDFPRVGSYTMVFVMDRGLLQQLWVVLTPGGKRWSIDHEEGNPANFITPEQWQALHRMLVPQTNVITIKTLYQVQMDARPVGAGKDFGVAPNRLCFPRELIGSPLFESEEEAKKAMQRFSDYWQSAMTREPTKPKKK